MKIGVLGTGMVGQAIATKLIQLGHQVMMGSRTANNEKAVGWVNKNGSTASQGLLADSAKFGEIVVNCTQGMGSLDALRIAGEYNLNGKILIDIANPLDFSKGMPPPLSICNTDSLGEQIQRAFPKAKIVKTLNTVNAAIMVEPSKLPGEHAIFVSGNDSAAKAKVTEILRDGLGWKQIIDLGDISTARGTEMLLPLWVRLYAAQGTPMFNFKLVKAE